MARQPNGLYRCSQCKRGDLTVGEMTPTGGRGRDGAPHYSWCKACAAVKRKARYRRQMLDDEKAAVIREQWKRSADKGRLSPDHRERANAATRKYQRELRSTPEGRAYVNRLRRERRAWLKANEPERYREMTEREKAQRQAYIEKPGVRKRKREAQRMWYALRAEKAGKVVQFRHRYRRNEDRMPVIPLMPLAVEIEREIAVLRGRERIWSGDTSLVDSPQERVCGAAGIAPRQLHSWRDGTIINGQVATIDRALKNLGWEWWEIYDPADGEHGIFSPIRAVDVVKWIDAADRAYDALGSTELRQVAA